MRCLTIYEKECDSGGIPGGATHHWVLYQELPFSKYILEKDTIIIGGWFQKRASTLTQLNDYLNEHHKIKFKKDFILNTFAEEFI